MRKPCKNKEDVIHRFKVWQRFAKIRGFKPGLPSPKFYGSKTKKTGALTLDNIVEGLDK